MKNNLNKSYERGITLLESLIAIVVMALGILGILGAQMKTLTDTQSGVRRAQAIRLIEDLGERLQNNPDALTHLNQYTTSPTTSKDCSISACSPDELAIHDIKQWRENVINALKGSDAIVFIPKGGDRQLGVMISWNENLYNSSGKNLSAIDKSELTSPFDVTATNSSGATVVCKQGLTCHLQYIQPTQRCSRSIHNNNELHCLN